MTREGDNLIDSINDVIWYIFEGTKTYSQYYVDITEEWLHMANHNIKIIKNARYVKKNGKRYYVNKTNKIEHKNREVANARWYINLMGGTLVYLPTINEDGGVSCADYKYYPPNSKKWYYLEEKETSGRGKSVFYHALEGKQEQAKIFLIDCTNSNFTDDQIHLRIKYIFKSAETKYVNVVIVKNKNNLFGVFKKRE